MVTIVVTKRAKPEKPAKPHKDFPLTQRSDGRWVKKVRGKIHYFGRDADNALAEWLRVKDHLLHGEEAPPAKDGTTLRDVVNDFLDEKMERHKADKISLSTFQGYYNAGKFLDQWKGQWPLSILTRKDFVKLGTKIAKGRSKVTQRNLISFIRIILQHSKHLTGEDFPHINALEKPTKKDIRVERNAKPLRMFEADEIRTIIGAAGVQLRAMTLLAINGGFGQTDMANLLESAVDLETAWIVYPRGKTGVYRRCPLWTETVDALREAMTHTKEIRATVKLDPECRKLVFITKNGRKWVRTQQSAKRAAIAGEDSLDPMLNTVDSVATEFAKLLRKLELKTHGRNFYALRHTFLTIGENANDQKAVNFLMGHIDSGMSDAYRERFDDERLKRVTDYVHDWLFPPKRIKGTVKRKPKAR